MIEGRVNAALESVVRLVIRGSAGRTREIEAVIDTGFNGFLTLPAALAEDLELTSSGLGSAILADGSNVRFDVYAVFLEWDGERRYVKADATGSRPLVGMGLLHRHILYAEVVEGGRVVIEAQR